MKLVDSSTNEKQCWKIRGQLYFKILPIWFKRPVVSLLVRSKKYQKASEWS
jgi:hypothetical protein